MGAFGFQPHGGSLRRQAEGLNKRLGPRKFDLRSNAAGCRHAAEWLDAFALRPLADTAARVERRHIMDWFQVLTSIAVGGMALACVAMLLAYRHAQRADQVQQWLESDERQRHLHRKHARRRARARGGLAAVAVGLAVAYLVHVQAPQWAIVLTAVLGGAVAVWVAVWSFPRT